MERTTGFYFSLKNLSGIDFEPLFYIQIVYKRYASLFFCFATDRGDNELLTLEIIHRFVEVLDQYFGSVCELVCSK